MRLQHIFHSDQFGYARHARAFRTQIDLNKQKLMQTNLGTESTGVFRAYFRLWIRLACVLKTSEIFFAEIKYTLI
jgi:hypothetical protein